MRTRFVFSMIRRELRAAARRFGFYGSCMAIGIAVVVCLHSLREAVNEAVDLRSKELLGADLRLESRDGFGPEILEALEPIEAAALQPATRVTRLGSMALAEKSQRSRLVDLVAIDGEYPIYGAVFTKPAYRWDEFGRAPGRIFVDSTLLIQLDIAVGDTLRIGGEDFVIAAAVTKAPGSAGLQSEIAPRVFLTASDLDRTQLVVEGSLVEHLRYWKLPPDIVGPWAEQHELLFEDQRVRVQTVQGYQEDMSDAFSN